MLLIHSGVLCATTLVSAQAPKMVHPHPPAGGHFFRNARTKIVILPSCLRLEIEVRRQCRSCAHNANRPMADAWSIIRCPSSPWHKHAHTLSRYVRQCVCPHVSLWAQHRAPNAANPSHAMREIINNQKAMFVRHCWRDSTGGPSPPRKCAVATPTPSPPECPTVVAQQGLCQQLMVHMSSGTMQHRATTTGDIGGLGRERMHTRWCEAEGRMVKDWTLQCHMGACRQPTGL